jgi:hypothetical protein
VGQSCKYREGGNGIILYYVLPFVSISPLSVLKKPFSTPSSYLNLSLPTFEPSTLLSATCYPTLIWPILIIRPNHSDLLPFTSATKPQVVISPATSEPVLLFENIIVNIMKYIKM